MVRGELFCYGWGGKRHRDVTVCRSFYSKVLLALIFLVGLRVLRTLGWIPWI